MKIIIFYDGVKKYENIKPTLRSTRALLIMKKKNLKMSKISNGQEILNLLAEHSHGLLRYNANVISA